MAIVEVLQIVLEVHCIPDRKIKSSTGCVHKISQYSKLPLEWTILSHVSLNVDRGVMVGVQLSGTH